MELKHHEAVLSRRDSFVIDPRRLKIDSTYNVRELSTPETQDHIAALKESIAANGVRVPLEVRLTGTDIYIVAGHCRHAAVMELIADGRDDIKGVPCVPEPKSINDAERVLNLVISNSGKPLTTLEVAEVVRRLEAFGWTEEQIQKRMRWKSRASVKQHAEVAALPETMKDHIRKGEISPTTARNLARNDDLTPAEKEEMIRANLEENKRLGVGRKNPPKPKVTRKTLERDKPKAKPPTEPPAPSAAAHTDAPAPTQAHTEPLPVSLPLAVGDHFDSTPALEHIAVLTTRRALKELIAALEPFANLAHDQYFDLRADDDVVEVPLRHLKRAWIVFARVTGQADPLSQETAMEDVA